MTVLIIGVGPGLGLALVNKFFENEFNIIMVARNKEKLESYATQFTGSGQKVLSYSANVGDHNTFTEVLKKIVVENGEPDVAIYNVSILRTASPSQIDYTTFEEDFNINIGGALITYQNVVEAMKSRGKGTFLVTGGGISLSPYHEFASLGVGKSGLRNLVYSFGQESKSSGVNVNMVTINGQIEEGTKFDPSKIADKFYDIYLNGLPDGEIEFIYQ